MIGDWILAFRRVIVRVGIRRRGHPPHIIRFRADRWQTFRIYAAAAQIQSQTLDNIAMSAANQPTLLIMKSNVEGLTYYKESATEFLPRALRPFEITDDVVWQSGERPIITITNPTTQPGWVDIFFATRDDGGSGGGGGGGFLL